MGRVSFTEAVAGASEEIVDMLIDAAMLLGCTHFEYDPETTGYVCFHDTDPIAKILFDHTHGWVLESALRGPGETL